MLCAHQIQHQGVRCLETLKAVLPATSECPCSAFHKHLFTTEFHTINALSPSSYAIQNPQAKPNAVCEGATKLAVPVLSIRARYETNDERDHLSPPLSHSIH